MFEKIQALIVSRRKNLYIKRRKVLLFAPYPRALYAEFLSRCQRSKRLQNHPFAQQNIKNGSRIHLFVRHDIDTKTCIEKMHLLLDIDGDLGIPAGVYFRADDEEYLLRGHKELIRSCKESGFEIGLHTCCYTKDDFLEEFKRETDHFAEETGFAPKSFSVHGLGNYRLEVRMRFYQEIPNRLEEFGYNFGDVPLLRSYDYVIQDCHFDESRRFFIYDDFSHLPPFSHRGAKVLILTHPCYWGG